jgi:GNAT superfamily N-acetyltransferase
MVDIVRLEPTDRADWQELFGAFLQRDWPADEYERAWTRLLDDKDVHAFGARADGRLVGLAHFFPHAHTNGPPVCCLHHLFTAPDWRDRGVGQALIAAVAGWARDRGCFRLYWVVQEGNVTARRLYDAVATFDGFIEYRMQIDAAAPAPVAPDGIDIAPLSPHDRARWEMLFRAYIDFYERELPDQEYERTWRRLGDDDEIHALGARIDGELVGIVHFMAHAHTNGPDVCYLQDLFTDAGSRGRGVGRALIAAVADWARVRGCGRVYWATQRGNTTARSLYDQIAESAGFLIYRMPL